MTDVIHVNTRLRPLRLGFLVRPRDRSGLQLAIDINTCLWGGLFNAIIPVFKQFPRPWSRRRFLHAGRSQAVWQGYLSAYEPDVLVAMNQDDAKLASKPKAVFWKDLLDTNGSHFRTGRSVLEHYRSIYRDSFQYLHRHPRPIVEPTSPGAGLRLFSAAAFGSFESKEGFMEPLRAAYREAFQPEQWVVGPDKMARLVDETTLTPLRMGFHGLTVFRRERSRSTGVFVLDPEEPLDIIDFWNLRALGAEYAPVPLEWLSCIADQNLRCRFSRNGEVDLMVSETVGLDRLTPLLKRMGWPAGQRLNPHYPRIWDDWGRRADGVSRCTVSASDVEVEVTPDENGLVSIPTGAPSNRESQGRFGKATWCNVVTFSEARPSGERAGVLPALERPENVVGPFSAPASSSEGLLFYEGGPRHRIFVRLPRSVEVAQEWFRERGVKAQVSSAGRTLQELLRALGGVDGIWSILNADLIHLLERYAGGLAEEDSGGDARKLHRRFINHDDLWDRIRKIAQKTGRHAVNHLNALLRAGVFEVGVVLECAHCRQKNWYSLAQLAADLPCERCLRGFPFPSHHPTDAQWAYRLRGPFSVPNCAQGGYSALAAVWCLAQIGERKATIVPSIDLSFRGGKSLEMDLALWLHQWRRDGSERVQLAVVECKSFGGNFRGKMRGLFEAKDVQRMRKLAKLAPGTVLVFATFRDGLSSTEKKRLAALAKWGRGRPRDSEWKSPVIVLTARELFSFSPPPYCWREGNADAGQVAQTDQTLDDLEAVADATQQRYLDMEPYASWRERWARGSSGTSFSDAKHGL